MRNFLILLRKYNFGLFFLFMLSSSMYLLFAYNSYHKTIWVNGSNYTVGKFHETYSEFSDYLKLGITNQALADENARLRALTQQAFYVTDTIHYVQKDTIYKQQYTYISAKVINNSVTRKNNYITLNKGTMHGIKPDMAVISSNGITGIVRDVSEHYCTVMSVLNWNSKISSKIKKNEYFGSTIWDGNSPDLASLIDIPIHAPVEIGDSIVTSEFSTIFPEGILIGTVAKTGKIDESFKDIKIKLATNFRKVSYVYVITNQFKEERDSLERRLPVDR